MRERDTACVRVRVCLPFTVGHRSSRSALTLVELRNRATGYAQGYRFILYQKCERDLKKSFEDFEDIFFRGIGLLASPAYFYLLAGEERKSK